jgi:hypothetical protein
MARAAGAQLVLNLASSEDKNLLSRGSFSLDKWKAQVSRFKKIKLDSYIADGTIVGHYLIDEPGHATGGGARASPRKRWRRWPNLASNSGPT